jgi:hypothetical protein
VLAWVTVPSLGGGPALSWTVSLSHPSEADFVTGLSVLLESDPGGQNSSECLGETVFEEGGHGIEENHE